MESGRLARAVPGKLRNEDYVAFLDESGEPGLQVVAGVLVPARWLRGAERRWQDFLRAQLGSKSGRVEVKGRDLVRGEGVSLHAQRVMLNKGITGISALGAGRAFYRMALEHIAGIAEVRVLAVGLPTKYPGEVYRLWYWMMYAALVEKSRAPRPRLPLVVIDGEDESFRQGQDLIAHRFYRQFPHCQPYVGRGKLWFVGGSALHDSKLHPLVQMADLVAGAARHAIAGRAPYDDWFSTHLVDYAFHRKPARDIDIARRARAQLRRRSKTDACNSGWPAARLPA